MDSLEDNSQAPSSRQQMRKLLFLNTWASMQILNPLKGQSAAAIERSKPPLDAIAKARRGLLSFEEEAELVEKHTYMKKKPKPPDSQASRIYSHLPGIFLLVLAVLWTAGALFAASFLIFSALAIAFISLFVPPQFMVETITPAMRKLTMYMLQQQVEALNDKIEHRTNTSSKTLTPATIHDASSDLRREVQVRVMVEHLWDINSSRHYFHADVLLEASWVADETADEWLALLKHQADWDAGLPPDEYWQNLALEVQEGLNKRTIDCWKPDLYFGNLIEVHEEAMRNIVPGENYEKWYRIKVTDAGQLRICERSRVVGDFAELFELHYFPADRQALTVEVRSKQAPHLVHLSLPSDYYSPEGESIAEINSETFVHAGSWALSDRLRMWETRSLPSETLNVPARIYPQLQINMRAVRKFEQYISDVFTPQGILSLCATSSLLVPRDALGERLAITLTMVLASIAFKSTVNASIPSVAYMTWTDTYINTNFYFLCTLVAADLIFVFLPDDQTWSSLSSYLSFQSNSNAQEWASVNVSNKAEMDIVLFFVFVIILLVGNLLFGFNLWLLHEANKQWLNDHTFAVGNKTIRTERKEHDRMLAREMTHNSGNSGGSMEQGGRRRKSIFGRLKERQERQLDPATAALTKSMRMSRKTVNNKRIKPAAAPAAASPAPSDPGGARRIVCNSE